MNGVVTISIFQMNRIWLIESQD
uniref:Uncharacterized protein n=1 Tax=Rhizophora mucronata TaxID=61149 RepID=A0A2P2N3E3_RHIMU